MKTKKTRFCGYTLLFSLVLSGVSYGTLIYNYGTQWDFAADFSTAANPVKDGNGAIIWKYCGGKSTDSPSSVGLLPAYDSTKNAWKGSDTPYYSWIGQGSLHAVSTFSAGNQLTPFLEWVSPVNGHVQVDIQVSQADMNYQAVVFLNDQPLSSHDTGASDWTYQNSSINLGVGDTITLMVKQEINNDKPTVQTNFTVTYLVPEPITITMLGVGLVGLLVRNRKSAV